MLSTLKECISLQGSCHRDRLAHGSESSRCMTTGILMCWLCCVQRDLGEPSSDGEDGEVQSQAQGNAVQTPISAALSLMQKMDGVARLLGSEALLTLCCIAGGFVGGTPPMANIVSDPVSASRHFGSCSHLPSLSWQAARPPGTHPPHPRQAAPPVPGPARP